MHRRSVLKGLATSAALTTLARPSLAQSAQGVVKIVFPFGAGGGGDTLCRVLSDDISTAVRRAVIVENRTGADGRLGINAAKASPHDGSVFLVTTGPTMWLMPLVHKAPGFDPFNDFEPVAQLALFEFCVAVANSTGIKTPADLTRWVKVNPAQATYAIPGAGTLPHFIGVSLGKAIGVEMQKLAYRGGAPAINDLVGGQIPLSVGTVADALQQYRAANIRIIATSGAERSHFTPEVPTLKESGFDIIADAWYGMWAPKGTPEAAIAEMNAAVIASLARPEIKTKLEAFGLVATGTQPSRLTQIMRENVARWKPIIDETGYRMEN